LEQFEPTWYTAVPTMHQAILDRVSVQPARLGNHRLRFIRSSSSALPPQLMQQLEEAFRVPVIESYGMTEAAHQMASNPLPPLPRKPGSVGMAAGPAVAVMDEAGRLLPPGATGEVVIRGPNVTLGYASNPEANRSAFTDGWFRTGDQGHLDAEGYLFLTGRLKELINRGGEKIAPREIDEVLLDHPGVAQALTFAMPHSKLGEEVAAAVVLRDGASAAEKELRAFAATRLSDFKVPRRVVILKEIPKGPTGKLQRIGLAEKLGLTAESEAAAPAQKAPPRTELERTLAGIWGEVLGLGPVGVHDNFFQTGGDSLLAAQLLTRLQQSLQVEISMLSLLDEAATVAGMAELIESRDRQPGQGATGPEGAPASLVKFQPKGINPPLFFVCSADGGVFYCRHAARHLAKDYPVYGLQARGVENKEPPRKSVEEMATDCLQDVRAVRPHGPYHLIGWCFGGLVALEMAQRLRAEGEEVGLLALIDTVTEVDPAHAPLGVRLRYESWRLQQRVAFHQDALGRLSLPGMLAYLLRKVRGRARRLVGRTTPRHAPAAPANPGDALEQRPEFIRASRLAARAYSPRPFPGRVVFLRSDWLADPLFYGPGLLWRSLIAGGLEVRRVPGDHMTMFEEPHAGMLAAELKACLSTVSH
jgi:thioesterase domain-containing protein